jgi:uncharacterized membrane protein
MDDTPTTEKGTAEAPQGGTPPKPARANRMGFAVRLRTYFFAGILVTAPISITFYLAWLFITVVDDWVRPFIPPAYNPENYLRFSLPGIGLVVVLVGLTFIGAVTANFLGRFFLRLSERVLNRMPVIRSVYSAVKQIFETVLAQQSGAFREVVLIEYPRRGIWALGFITGTTQGEVQELTEDEMLNVFLPTTPNPTSGFLLFVPKSEVVRLAMSVEEGIKMVVSGGIVTPPDRRPPEARKIHIPARAPDRVQS